MWLVREDVPSFIERDNLIGIKCETLEDFLEACFRPYHEDKTKNKDFSLEFKGKRIYENGSRLAYVEEGDEVLLERQYKEWKENSE